MAVVDNNILSSLSKGQALPILPRFFGKLMTPIEVVQELREDVVAGLPFVEAVEDVLAFESTTAERWLEVIPGTEPRNQERERLLHTSPALADADAACLALAKERGTMLVTDDRLLGRTAERYHVEIMDLPTLLLACANEGVFDDPEEAFVVVRRIRERDRYRFTDRFLEQLRRALNPAS